MKTPNLYKHGDDGLCCLVIGDMMMRHPSSGEWLDAVAYATADGKLRTSTKVRWLAEIEPVPDYKGNDEQVLAMIRRCNPEDFDMADVWAGWHDSESAINAEVLELVMAATLASGIWSDPRLPKREIEMDGALPLSAALTIGPADLQYILQNYTVEREAVEGGYRVTIRK